MRSEPVLRMSAATRRYSASTPEVGFQLGPLDLELAAGEWLAIEGRSGSGKTTLLHIACGIDRVDAGNVVLFGSALETISNGACAAVRGKHVGLVHQEAVLLEHLSVWENVSVRWVPHGTRARERRERAAAALEQLALLPALDRDPRSLSGGERQRVAVARALAADPALIVADEPTSNIDAATTELVLAALEASRKGGAAILASSHDPLALGAADRRVCLAEGRIEG